VTMGLHAVVAELLGVAVLDGDEKEGKSRGGAENTENKKKVEVVNVNAMEDIRAAVEAQKPYWACV